MARQRILEPDHSIALDERDDDVPAAQAGEQLVGGVSGMVTLELVREDRAILDAGAHRAHLVDGEGGGARRGKRHAGDELRPERPTKDPDGAERRDGTERPAAVAGCDPGQAKHRQGREDEYGHDEHGRAGHDEVRVPRSDRVPQRLDPDAGVPPVGNGIERPVEGRVDAHVEDFHDHQQTENRADDPGQDAPALGGQGEGEGENGDALERESQERTGRETSRMVRSDQGDPDEQQGADRERHGGARPYATCSGRRNAVRRVSVTPKPPCVAVRRLTGSASAPRMAALARAGAPHL